MDYTISSEQSRREVLCERVAAGRSILFVGYDISRAGLDRSDLALQMMKDSMPMSGIGESREAQHHSGPTDSHKILVVDDDPELQTLLRRLIRGLGYDVTIAHGGQQAMDLLEASPFEVAVVDLRLPGPDGLEVMRQIRDRQLDVDVVILTAYASVDSAVEALRHGAYDYITKPFNIDDVRATIRRVMRKRQLEKDLSSARSLSRVTFPMAAQVYELKHGRPALESLIAHNVEEKAVLPESYRFVADLPFRLIISLNYDSLLEGTLCRDGVECQTVFNSHQLQRCRRGELRIVKPYGSVQDGHSMVITEEDQLDFLSRWPSMLDTMGLGLPGRTLLLVGCDLMDRDFRRLYRDIAPRLAAPAYLIQRGLPDALKDYWADQQLQVIDDDLTGVLEEAAAMAEAKKAQLAPVESFEALELETAPWTETGPVRSVNQDCVEVVIPPEPRRTQRGSLFLVADGMGGYEGGEVASQLTSDVVVEEYYTLNGKPGEGLTLAIKSANQAVSQEAERNPVWRGMGTTVVAAVVHGSNLYVANVGDSRAYMVRRGLIEQITWDHSFVAEEVRKGTMTVEQARDHPQRNLLTRALGASGGIDVDLFERDLRRGDVIVLCSDGLTEYVTDREIQEEVRTSPPRSAVKRLAKFASRRGGSDNISIVVVKVS